MTDLPSDPEMLRERVRQAESELARLELTLNVVGTVDLDAGILNRNGVIEAIDRGRKWMARRGDLYGLIVVSIPGLADLEPTQGLETVKHMAATIWAGLREVDEVGRLDSEIFGACLSDVHIDATEIVARRVHELVTAALGATTWSKGCRIGAIEVTTEDPTALQVLDAGLDAMRRAGSSGPVLERI